jgi:hypothetical protein
LVDSTTSGVMSSLKSKTTKDLKKNKSILPKKPAKMLSPAPNLSTEFVEENDLKEDENLEEASTSDDEESLPDNPALPAPKGKAKTAVTAAGTDSGSGNESESAEDSDSEDAEDEGEKPSNTGGKSSVDSISAKYVSILFKQFLANSIAAHRPLRKQCLSRHLNTNLLLATNQLPSVDLRAHHNYFKTPIWKGNRYGTSLHRPQYLFLR